MKMPQSKNKIKTNITVFLEVFNEAERIEATLENFLWVDEIVLIDKSSTDETIAIAKEYPIKIIKIPYSDISDKANKVIKEYKTNSEWYFFPTASSLISPGLAKSIILLTTNKEFKYDSIGLPLKMYVLGISSPKSPWGQNYKELLIRKNALKLSDRIHQERTAKEKNCFNLVSKNAKDYLFHLTHPNPESMFIKHARYTKYERVNGNKNIIKLDLSKVIFELIKAFLITIQRKTLFMGSAGIALTFAYLSYYMMKYVSLWYQCNKDDLVDYKIFREESIKLWKANKIN
jgi:glycosyltransferase involved in cell wall biosynthesis